jgi:SAM-dependent methyltransferase
MNQPFTDTDGVPLRLAPDEVFERALAFFRAVPYDEATLGAALSLGSMADLRKADWDAADSRGLPPALRWCLDVFVRGRTSAASEARAVCGESAFAALLELGLLRPLTAAPDRVESPVSLHPVDGFLVVSDRHEDTFLDRPAPRDLVFPANDQGTLKLARLMPASNGGESLDLGGGCGLGALHMSRTARRATTSDITARAALFAAFNARLNGVAIESVEGDLYAPVLGRRFDLITFHPPFLPETANARVFSVGGETGEEITRRAIAGLPDFLRPGGFALIVCAGQDTGAATFEQRARDWLGSSAEDFDIVFALEWKRPVGEAMAVFGPRAKLTESEAHDLAARLEAAGTRRFVYGALALRRRADNEEPITDPPLRIGLAADTVAADFEQLFAWRRRRRSPDFEAWLAKAQPRLAPDVEVVIDDIVEHGVARDLLCEASLPGIPASRPVHRAVDPAPRRADVRRARIRQGPRRQGAPGGVHDEPAREPHRHDGRARNADPLGTGPRGRGLAAGGAASRPRP